MALEYSTLKTRVIDFSGRDDLSDKFDTFLLLAEAAMYNNDVKALRVKEMESTSTLTTVGGTNLLALPTDFLEARSLKLSSGGVMYELTYGSPSVTDQGVSGRPSRFTIVGTDIKFNYVPDDAYDIVIDYYARPTDLTPTNNTNAILTNYPDVYLYGCIQQVYDYTSESQDSEMYYAKFIRAIRGAVKSSERYTRKTPAGRYNGATP
jgi:hypothetical protein